MEWHGSLTVKKFDDIFSRVETIPTCDGQIDGRTDGHLATALSALCIASRGKKASFVTFISSIR